MDSISIKWTGFFPGVIFCFIFCHELRYLHLSLLLCKLCIFVILSFLVSFSYLLTSCFLKRLINCLVSSLDNLHLDLLIIFRFNVFLSVPDKVPIFVKDCNEWERIRLLQNRRWQEIVVVWVTELKTNQSSVVFCPVCHILLIPRAFSILVIFKISRSCPIDKITLFRIHCLLPEW